jgi:hypothetical protein
MMILETIATCAFIGFVAGTAALIITSVLKLVSNNKVLDKVLMTAIWVYGVLGFTTIILSFVSEMLR